VRTLRALGADLVIGRREGYRMWDLDGRELLDLHLNGGTYNLGHRNPELVDVLVRALGELDIGNHHFPSVERASLAERLVGLTPGARYAVFGSSGGEAVDLAIKSARRATGRRRIVSLAGAYHGHTGLALAAGDERAAAAFLSDGTPDEFVHIPFDDLPAAEAELEADDVAAVIVEPLPATLGFPVPSAGFLPGLAEACRRHGTALVADEVQTGLGRTGPLWSVQRVGVVPDALVTGKGLSGGLYPITATLLSDRLGAWLEEDGWGHISTFGGSEVGCRVAQAVLDLTLDAATRAQAAQVTARFETGLAELAARYPDWLVEVRQTGLVIGLRFAHEHGGMLMTGALLRTGVWAIYAGFDPSALQVKPGLVLSDGEVERALDALDAACAAVSSDV
jgi:acetylornithine/succinyldiaminopimelate/putrescine aminotransferase